MEVIIKGQLTLGKLPYSDTSGSKEVLEISTEQGCKISCDHVKSIKLKKPADCEQSPLIVQFLLRIQIFLIEFKPMLNFFPNLEVKMDRGGFF
jgi:hypothetical protein